MRENGSLVDRERERERERVGSFIGMRERASEL